MNRLLERVEDGADLLEGHLEVPQASDGLGPIELAAFEQAVAGFRVDAGGA